MAIFGASSAKKERQAAREQAAVNMWSAGPHSSDQLGWLEPVMMLGGAVAGGFMGGPMGVAAGAQAGRSMGRGFHSMGIKERQARQRAGQGGGALNWGGMSDVLGGGLSLGAMGYEAGMSDPTLPSPTIAAQGGDLAQGGITPLGGAAGADTIMPGEWSQTFEDPVLAPGEWSQTFEGAAPAAAAGPGFWDKAGDTALELAKAAPTLMGPQYQTPAPAVVSQGGSVVKPAGQQTAGFRTPQYNVSDANAAIRSKLRGWGIDVSDPDYISSSWA